jgi:hypothetical protein
MEVWAGTVTTQPHFAAQQGWLEFRDVNVSETTFDVLQWSDIHLWRNPLFFFLVTHRLVSGSLPSVLYHIFENHTMKRFFFLLQLPLLSLCLLSTVLAIDIPIIRPEPIVDPVPASGGIGEGEIGEGGIGEGGTGEGGFGEGGTGEGGFGEGGGNGIGGITPEKQAPKAPFSSSGKSLL